MRSVFLAVGFLLGFVLQPVMAAPQRVVLPAGVVPSAYDIAIAPDSAAKTFTGSVKIAVKIARETSDIELNAADLSFGKVALVGVAQTPQVAFDKTKETATLHFSAPLAPGDYVLVIDYTGKINDNAAGLFALDSDSPEGVKRALFTQFENSDARRFVPCWDEPAQKAVFTLTATLPAAEMAVSNMPVASEEKLPGGLKRVHFAPSPKMSSYLLFYGQGDFERISRKVGDVDVGVVVKRGDTAKAEYALDAAAQILPFYDDYFGTKYPLPKLDLIAGAGDSQFFSAMENWGAIFYFEDALLIDPKISGEDDKRSVYITIAHEMAHQWFGDLVTMAWWDDLWLNEGFASWMEYKVANKFHPEWNVWLQSLGAKEYALGVDAHDGTHPVIQPIADVLQANQAFDAITYQKGQSVIRMLENYIGESAFRDGVRAYMKKYAYGNTVTDDLWQELEKTSSTPISDVAHAFTLQPGVPLIRVTKTQGGIRLTQERFSADDSGKEPLTWPVPVVVKAGNREWRGLVGADRPADITLAKGVVPVVNAGQAGYFRTLYDGALSAKLAKRFALLTPSDQRGLLGDGKALGDAGLQPLTDVLALTLKARPNMDPLVLASVTRQIASLAGLYRDLPGRARAFAFGRGVLGPLFAKVGWTPKPGETQNTGILRESLIGALAALDDPKIVAQAKKRFADYVKTPDSLSSDLRDVVFGIAAAHADVAAWDQFHDLARNAKNSMEQREFYQLLGAAHDKTLAGRALDLALTGEAPATLRPAIIGEVAGYYPDLAFDFAAAHVDALDGLLEPDSRNQYYARLAAGSYDPAMIEKLDAFAKANIPETARREVVKTKAAVAYSIMLRTRRVPEIDRWLNSRGKGAGKRTHHKK